jgi:hypothetical protein
VGKGCRIYADRPDVCRVYGCRWLIDPSIPDYWYPAKSKLVLSMVDQDPPRLDVHVDPGWPNRWREEPWFTDLRTISRVGLTGELMFYTYVLISNRTRWLVLPNKVISTEDTEAGIIARTGEEEWEFIRCEDHEHGKELYGKMNEMLEFARTLSTEQRQQLAQQMKAAGAQLAQPAWLTMSEHERRERMTSIFGEQLVEQAQAGD